MRLWIVAGLVMGAFAVAVPPADAATVAVVPIEKSHPRVGSWTVWTVTLVDSIGEDNDVTLSREEAGVVVHDAGAPVQPGADCTLRAAHTAVCTRAFALSDADIALGGGADRARLDPSTAPMVFDVDGGAGDDVLGAAEVIAGGVLTGGPSNDRLIGDEELDFMRGGPGADVLAGGGGWDQISGGSGADIVDGGPGLDQLTYAGRSTPVRADLARGVETGDGDVIAGIERVIGGDGTDVLVGTRNNDRLAGGRGDDTLLGPGGHDKLWGPRYGSFRLGGDDVLRGGPGRDELTGGPGNDHLDGGGGADELDGDYGRNVLVGAPGDDLLVPDPHLPARNPTSRWRCAPDTTLCRPTGARSCCAATTSS